jgi:hypothetical protein
MTAVLVLVVFAFVSSDRTARWTPLAVWIVVAVLVWRGARYTGTSLNAARSLGPAVLSGIWTDYWVYLIGPVAGAIVAVGLWVLVPRETLTAKLFHDPRYVADTSCQAGHRGSDRRRCQGLRSARLLADLLLASDSLRRQG